MLKKHEQGIGLIEILVALLLLAVAVLGFSAMQMRAVKATDETLFRSDAMVAIRAISEDMRLHPSKEDKDIYKRYIASQRTNPTAKPPKSCLNVACSKEQQIQYNIHQAMKLANDSQVFLNALDCPSSARSELKKVCLIASWGTTTPTMGGGANDCTDASGTYKKGATCFVMETY